MPHPAGLTVVDLTAVTGYRVARSRADLALAPGETFLAGGTWLFSEPQPHVTGLVDLTGMGWDEIEFEPATDGPVLRIGATCTIARLVAWAQGRAPDLPAPPAEWCALGMVPDAANALLASFKVWRTATVGGNICQSFAAGAMIALTAALDAVAWILTPDGEERRMPVADIPAGNGANSLRPGEVLRAVEVPAAALGATARLEKIALAELGRSGSVVTGRVDRDGRSVFTVTAATLTPHVMRFDALPDAAQLAGAVAAASDYYTDPLGAADWRRAVSGVLAERIRIDLAGA